MVVAWWSLGLRPEVGRAFLVALALPSPEHASGVTPLLRASGKTATPTLRPPWTFVEQGRARSRRSEDHLRLPAGPPGSAGLTRG